MKVFEIVEAPNNVIQFPRTPANRTPSNSTPATPASTPDPEIKNLRVNSRGRFIGQKLSEVPQISFKYNGKDYSGPLDDILEQLDEEGHRGAKRALRNKAALATQKFNRFKTALGASKILASLASLGLAIWEIGTIYQDWANEHAKIELFFKEVVYKGGSFDGDDETFQRMVSDINRGAVYAGAAFAAAEILQWWTAGKAIKVLRWIRAGQAGLASTGVGVLFAALAFAITEGAQWLVKWAIEKYGPDMFEQLIFDAINEVSKSSDYIPDLDLKNNASLERAAEEVRAKARQDRAEQANAALQTLGQSNPALTAPGQTDDDFNRSLERLRGSN